MAIYFAGKYGRVRLAGYSDRLFTCQSWTYEYDNSLIDITSFRSKNTNLTGSVPKEQYIGNLYRGTITANGILTDVFQSTINFNQLLSGQEGSMDLFLYYGAPANIGFTNLPIIIDNFDFSVDVAGTGTFAMTARLNQPKV